MLSMPEIPSRFELGRGTKIHLSACYIAAYIYAKKKN